MKENINQLTGILIIFAIGAIYYLSSKTENITERTDTAEIVNPSEEVNKTAIDSFPEIISEPTERKITGKISWPKNREAKFYLHDTTITVYVDWIGKFEAVIPNDYEGYVTFHHGNETTNMYLNLNSHDIHITINTKEFDETITYEGSEESNYLAWKYLYQEASSFSPDIYNSSAEELSASFDSIFQPILIEIEKFNIGEATFYNDELSWMNNVKDYYLKRHEQVQNLPKVGEAAIDFSYPDIDSNIVSLSDFKGSYVYVDVWATWCGPCKYEIPFLAKLEKDYHNANIIFMSVSIDKEDKRQIWKDMIQEYNMKGVQLIATDAWQSKICQDYAINGIPRFMLFDMNGNVISLDAPRPSSEAIRETLDRFFNEEIIEKDSITELEETISGEDITE